jgi:hypothetical protein
MKNIFLKLTFLAVFALVLASCEKEDYTGYSTANFVKPSATYASASGSNIAVNETSIDPDNGSTYTFSATLSSPSLVDTYIDLSKVGGTLTSDEFSSTDIYIPAQSLTGTGTVTIYRTSDAEPVETLQIKANALGKSANVTGTSSVYTITLNSDYHAVDVAMSWAEEFTFNNTGGGACTVNFKSVDIDFYIYDSDFNDLGIYDAASGSHPEHVEFSMLPNGDYYIIADIYDNPLVDYAINKTIHVVIDWEQENMGIGKVYYNGFNTNDAGGTEIVAVLTVNNGVYSLSAY